MARADAGRKARQTVRWGLAVLVLVAPAAAGAAPSACVSTPEASALDTRVLQTELMVAALACGFRDDYNGFVTKYRKTLGDQAKVLKGFFSRGGRGGETGLNSFVTRLANDSSAVSMGDLGTFCTASRALFDEAAGASVTDFGQLLRKPWMAERHGFSACDSQTMAGAPSAPRIR
jgi:hypothetical protein